MPPETVIRSLSHLFFHSQDTYQKQNLLVWDGGTYSSREFADAVLRLAHRFHVLGLAPGDRVAVFSDNRPEWHIADFAIALCRLVSVPIYLTLAPNQARHLLAHSGARAMVYSGEAERKTLEPLLEHLPELEWLFSMDDGFPFGPPPAEFVGTLRRNALETDPEETATIVYTSGTTGTPKGVMLSHRNLAFDMEQSIKRLPAEREVDRALSILPLSHVFERMLCYGYFRRGVSIVYGDWHDLSRLLKTYRPGLVGCVPRVLEKIREAVDAKVAELNPRRQKISSLLVEAALDRLHHPNRRSLRTRVLAPLADKLMFAKIHAQLGGLEYIICGGAWLDPKLEEFFRAAGFAVLQGYGLTETSPVVCFNEFGNEKTGSVGRPIEGVEVKLTGSGEILVRGGNVMKGYFRDPEATAAAFEDGWFRTGDVGRIDDDGCVTITGRQKEILVLSNGKNISYAPIEQALCGSRFIEHAYVVGEGRNFASVLLIPHRSNLMRHAQELGIGEAEVLTSPKIHALYTAELARHQAEFSRFEQVKRFGFLDEAALLDPELVTPTQKVRRNVLEKKYFPWIEKLYHEDHILIIPPPSKL